MKNKKKDLYYYLNLPWTYTVELDKDNKGKKIYIVSVNELSGIKTDAYTLDEAMENIKEPMEAMFELYMEMGKEIPEPIDQEKFKGEISYHTSSSRHYLLAKAAQKRKVSVNKLLDELIDSNLKNK